MSVALKSAKSIVPLMNRVLIQRVKVEAKTASGILLPEQNAPKSNQGKVLAVGPGFNDEKGNLVPVTVAVGDTVILPSFSSGSPIQVGDEELLLFRDSEILAKIREETN